MNFAPVTSEHRWLKQLAGNWASDTQCGPDPVKDRMAMTDRVESLGEYWILIAQQGTSAHGTFSSQITLGYDPAKSKFVGTYVGSMMPMIWHYEGTLDESGKVLTLNSEGPRFDDKPGIGKYHDIIEIVNADEWIFRSEIQQDDGTWKEFMRGSHRRAAQ